MVNNLMIQRSATYLRVWFRIWLKWWNKIHVLHHSWVRIRLCYDNDNDLPIVCPFSPIFSYLHRFHFPDVKCPSCSFVRHLSASNYFHVDLHFDQTEDLIFYSIRLCHLVPKKRTFSAVMHLCRLPLINVVPYHLGFNLLPQKTQQVKSTSPLEAIEIFSPPFVSNADDSQCQKTP